MSVSDARRRSASSATTRSLSLFSTESPPRTIAPAEGGHEQRRFSLGPPRLDFCPSRDGQLSLATGYVYVTPLYGRGSAPALHGCGLGSLLLVRDPTRALGIDADPGAHRARQRDREDVASLRRGGLRADDLL